MRVRRFLYILWESLSWITYERLSKQDFKIRLGVDLAFSAYYFLTLTENMFKHFFMEYLYFYIIVIGGGVRYHISFSRSPRKISTRSGSSLSSDPRSLSLSSSCTTHSSPSQYSV